MGNTYNNGLDYTCDSDGFVLYDIPMRTNQVLLASILWSARKMSASSAGTSNFDRLFCCFSNGRHSIWCSAYLRFVEFANESQGKVHRRYLTLRGYCVGYLHTPTVSEANRTSAGLSVIVRIKYIVDVSLTEDFMFATAVSDLLCITHNKVLGRPRRVYLT